MMDSFSNFIPEVRSGVFIHFSAFVCLYKIEMDIAFYKSAELTVILRKPVKVIDISSVALTSVLLN